MQKSAQLDAAHAMVASLQQMHSEAANALMAARTAHAEELQRLIGAQDALVGAAAHEAAAQEARQAERRCSALEGQLQEAREAAQDFERQLHVRLVPGTPVSLLALSTAQSTKL
jgi:hypothetical protein